jgi:hypothetical protein
MSQPASWKKVIVSGSSAQLNQLSVDTSVNITGSLNVSSSVFLQGLTNSAQATIVGIDTATGQLYYQGTGSFTANSASYALSASYAVSASYSDAATSSSYANNASTADSASYALSSSYASNASSADSASYALSASYSSTATSSSYATSASYTVNSDTASYVNPLHQKVEISGSLSINTTTGTALDVNADTFIFTGSFNTTGSVSLKGLQAASASYLLGYDPTTGNVTYEGTGSVVAVTSSFAVSSSHANNADNAISASYATEAGKVTNALINGTGIDSFTYNGSLIQTVAVSGAASLSTDAVVKWDGNAFANSSITDNGSGVVINNAAGVLIQQGGLYVTGASTFHDAVVFQGDITVQGTASFQNSENLAIADQFILLNSGSLTFQDSGFVINTGNSANSGSAFYLETAATTTGTDAQNGRFAVGSQVLPDATSVTAAEYANTTVISGSAPGNAVPQWGGTNLGHGNTWVDTTTGDIYIYA